MHYHFTAHIRYYIEARRISKAQILTVVEDPDDEVFDEADQLYVSKRETDAGNVIKVWWRYSDERPQDKGLELGTVILVSTRREFRKKGGKRR